MIRWLLIAGCLCGCAAAQDRVQRVPRQNFPATGAIEGFVHDDLRLGLGNVAVTIRSMESTGAENAGSESQVVLARTTGDGIFRVLDVRPGRYSIRAMLEGYGEFERRDLIVRAGELVSVDLTLVSTANAVTRQIPEEAPAPSYRDLPRAAPDNTTGAPRDAIPPDQKVFVKTPDRWKFDWPEYRRYGPRDEAPYEPKHAYDPFHRNKLKGDYPILGQHTFLAITLTSDTFVDGRALPTASGVSTASPGSSNFFGQFGQLALAENLAFSFDLFHGDTSFKPVDWRIKVTPEININYLAVQENGIVNQDVTAGTTRLDAHLGLQEAFFEAKIKDLSHSYDFVSTRLGIQTFNSDFRGFIFFDQEPGARVFGNLDANRYQYNLAYFAMLEKDTNSGLNSMSYRHQQVMVANLYRQDFLRPGYTIQASYHFNKDDPSVQFDANNFLVRPAPVGAVFSNGKLQTDAIRAHYLGVTGDGHFGWLNINHAFYQVLGHDEFDVIANAVAVRNGGRDINAQMAALELSVDRDWIRYRASFFFASGDKNPQGSTERGFDAIMDNPNFAGGFFSFWNREGIRLTSTGVGLVQGDSLLPTLRTSKLEGQSNFVNPGIFIYNGATDFDITPKLRGVLNLNLIRFDHTEPLELLLFQSPIHAGVGADSGIGVVYRPALSENISITGVFNIFAPFQGFRDIYTGSTLYSVAANVRFRF